MDLLSFLSIIFTSFISILFPIGLIIYFKRKYNSSLLYFVMGIIVFALFQMLIRIPLLSWLSGQFWFNIHIMNNKILYILFLSLTAGIFEEVGRFIAFKFVLPNHREWKNGIAFGIGHGGFEAVALVGLNYIAFILIAFNMNFQWFDSVVSLIPNVSQVSKLLVDSSPSIFFMAGIERFFVIIVHIGLSLLVLDGVRIGKITPLFMAIGLHTLLNFSIIFMSLNIWIVEAIVGIAAIVSFIYIKNKKTFWKFVK